MLVAVDASSRAALVVRTGAEFARQFGAKLILFRAVPIPPEFPPAAATHHADELAPKLLADGERELRELSSGMGNGNIEVRVVAASEPWLAIVAEADAQKVDAIVVGSHGYRLLDRILGTNAARVADRAHCVVMVVHEPVTPAAPPSSPYRKRS
ncbi:MAG TPA: universal stress protein [Polyangiaceae bacterium]|nr:universal stress protein [Polyangiaceae bacterium]